MKKIILSVLMVCGIASFTYAQEAGQLWLGGSLTGWTSKADGEARETTIGVLPEFGYQWNDSWGVGAQLGYQFEKVGALKANGFGISPFVRYSFLKGNIGNLFVDAGLGYSMLKIKDVDDKIHHMTAGFRPGVAVNVSEKIGLIGKFGSIGYDYTKIRGYKEQSGGFKVDMENVELGVIYKF